MPNTFDPRKFYRVSKAIVMPSLWNKSFGLVPPRRWPTGFPCWRATAGHCPRPWARPDGVLIFDIPSRYTPNTRIVPTAEELEPWVETILRLWDDEAFYRQQSEKAIAQAAQ